MNPNARVVENPVTGWHYPAADFYPDEEEDYPPSDVDDTPVTLQVRCVTCGEVEEEKKMIAEEAGYYTRNEDGTYCRPEGDCYFCMTGEPRPSA